MKTKKFILASLAIVMAHPMVGMQQDKRLIRAAVAGDIAQVQHFLDAGIPVDQVNEEGETALMFAAERGYERIVRLLIRAGASVNQANRDGSTALLWGTESGCKQIVRLLLDVGASVNHANKNDTTALMRAAERGYDQIVRLLLDAGAAVNHTTRVDSTALIWAAYTGREPICTLLVERMLKIPSDAQRKRIYCALLCIKECLGYDIYDLFKAPMFRAVIEEENRTNFQNSIAKREIDKIINQDIKQQLLAKYSQEDATPANKRRQTIHDL